MSLKQGTSVQFVGHSNRIPHGTYGKVFEKQERRAPYCKSPYPDRSGEFVFVQFKLSEDVTIRTSFPAQYLKECAPPKKRGNGGHALSLQNEAIDELLDVLSL